LTKHEIATRPFVYRNKKLVCDGVSLEALARAHGTPLYVYSAKQILYRAGLFSKAFAGKHTVCYSVKANSALGILKILDDAGAGFDIVSGGELERVRAVSKTAAKRVVFSGVGKKAEEMDAALKAGILIFNVESEQEIHLLAERASKLRKKARFALRVNPDVFAETHPYISTGLREHKFGVDISIARRVYREAAKSRWLDAAGVSVHIGSQIRSVEPFGAALDRVAALVRDLKKDGHKIRYVDAGGGFGIDYSAGAEHYDAAAKVKAYGAVIEKAVAGLGVHLLLEPGRFIVAQAGALVARVLYVKKNGAKTFVITDAGMNDLIRPALYQAHHEIVPVVRRGGKMKIVDVVGPVCESGDFFARDRLLSSLAPGDLVAILDAGAYAMSLSSNYNTRPRPAAVLVTGRRVKVIRRRETVKELLAVESF
jgi:diaminopimelate decarboxylase